MGRRKKKRYRQKSLDKYTLPDHSGGQNSNNQDASSKFPGLLSSSCSQSFLPTTSSPSAVSIFIVILFSLSTVSNLHIFIKLSLFTSIILSLLIPLSSLS